MNTNQIIHQHTDVDAESLVEAINALPPGKLQQKTNMFQRLYPEIEHALAREVPQKDLVNLLKQKGLPLSLGGFRSLLEAERKQRADGNEAVRCPHCNSALPRRAE